MSPNPRELARALCGRITYLLHATPKKSEWTVDTWDQFRAKAFVVFSDSIVEFVSSHPERFDDVSQLRELYSS